MVDRLPLIILKYFSLAFSRTLEPRSSSIEWTEMKEELRRPSVMCFSMMVSELNERRTDRLGILN